MPSAASSSCDKVLLTRRTHRTPLLYAAPDDRIDSASLAVGDLPSSAPSTNVIFNISLVNFFLYSWAIVSYLLDMGSDIFLSVSYYRSGDTVWFILTLVFVVVPCLIMMAFSLSWYYTDWKIVRKEPKGTKGTKAGTTLWCLRLSFHVLQLAPMIRYAECLLYAVKTRRHKTDRNLKRFFYLQMLYEEADSALLRMIESFTESAPQLLLQLYIIVTQKEGSTATPPPDGGFFSSPQFPTAVQVVSCSLSLVALSSSICSYQNALRSSRLDKKNLSLPGMFVMFLWKICVLASRILALAMFISAFPLYAGIFLAGHFLVMLAWILCQRTNFCEPPMRHCKELGFNLVLAVIYTLDYLNVKEGHTRLRYCFFYTVMCLENVALVLLWYISQNDESWYFEVVLIAVLVSFPVGLAFMALFYICFHPEKISYCVPVRQLFLFSGTEVVSEPTELTANQIASRSDSQAANPPSTNHISSTSPDSVLVSPPANFSTPLPLEDSEYHVTAV